MAKSKVVFVLGSPGAGKGTQCQKLSEEFGYPHLNTGGLLRKEKDNLENPYQAEIAKYMSEGNIVPSEISCSLLEREIKIHQKKSNGKSLVFLIDGFPRNMGNIDAWDTVLAKSTDLRFVLYLNCGEEICKQRLLARGKTSGRKDDNLESVQKRMPQYENESKPVIEHYMKVDGVIVHEIDAEQDADQVNADVKALFMQI